MLFQIFIVWLCLFLFASIFWFWGYLSNNPSVIDAGWSLGILLAGSLFIAFSGQISDYDYKTAIYWLLLIIWSLRLSVYLYLTRIKKKQVDKRYLDVSQKWTINKSYGFFVHYQFQAILMMMVSIPFFFIATMHIEQFRVNDMFALPLISMAIIFETIADLQLHNHKKKNPNSICDSGLWKYSRHPNYFFEWLIWVGFSIAAVSAPISLLSFLSPLLLLYLFLYVTGPITEASSMKSRGGAYIEYKNATSMFIPWFKKREPYDSNT